MIGVLLAACGAPDEVPAPAPPAPPARTFGRPETDAELRADRDAVRHPGDGGGRLVDASDPGPLVVGSPASLSVSLEVGPEGVAVGGSVQLVVSGFWGWSPPQGDDEEMPGYTTVAGPDGVTFEGRGGAGTWFATVGGRALAPGEVVHFAWRGRADRFAERAAAVFVGVDADGDGVRSLVPGELVVTTVPGPCARLLAWVPSAVAPGDPVRMRVAAVDAEGNGPCALDTSAKVSRPRWLRGPDRVALRGGLGEATFTAAEDGIGAVTVVAGELEVTTNPLVARAGAVPIRWADLQIHTALSDGSGAPADVLAYADHVAGLDVAALTDHDHWGFRALDGDADLRAHLRAAVEGAARPGFVPVMGMEWTSWTWGHRHVLFFGPDDPWPSSLQDATDTPAELFAALRGRDVVVIPHHVAGGPVAMDWSVGLDALEPVVEVTSVHGQSADPLLPGPVWDAVPGAFAEEQLRAGVRFGVVGGTDGHDGHPGLSHLAGGANGLTALVGADLTPEGVARALRSRSTYATNGPRTVVRFDVGGTPMGGSRPAGDTVATVRVIAPAPVERLELWSRAGLVGSRAEAAPVVFAEIPVSGLAGDQVWLRVIQVDGGVAWTSPVTFD